ncbi:hypothetical protein JCM8097_004882 [Rhodosporidiobolus ruineniae]
MWEPTRTEPPSDAAEAALSLLTDLDLVLLSPPDEPTWHSHNRRDSGVLDLAEAAPPPPDLESHANIDREAERLTSILFSTRDTT